MEDFLIDGELFHTHGIKGMLDDYIFFTEGLLSAYEATGNTQFLNNAERVLSLCISKFWDSAEGGFFDTEDAVLGTRLKHADDIPSPSANSLGIILLQKLFFLTGKDTFHRHATRALEAFSHTAQDGGIHYGYYFAALDAYFRMLKLTLKTRPESRLAMTALSSFYPYKCIRYEEDTGVAIPCIGDTCYTPAAAPEALRSFIAQSRELTRNT